MLEEPGELAAVCGEGAARYLSGLDQERMCVCVCDLSWIPDTGML